MCVCVRVCVRAHCLVCVCIYPGRLSLGKASPRHTSNPAWTPRGTSGSASLESSKYSEVTVRVCGTKASTLEMTVRVSRTKPSILELTVRICGTTCQLWSGREPGLTKVVIPNSRGQRQALAALYLPYTLHPTPRTLHPTPYTLHPTPHTLHATPYTPHTTPYTLHTT